MILNISIELIQTSLSFKNLRIYITKSKIRIEMHCVLTSRLLVNVIWLTRNEVLNNNIVFTIQSGFILKSEHKCCTSCSELCNLDFRRTNLFRISCIQGVSKKVYSREKFDKLISAQNLRKPLVEISSLTSCGLSDSKII